MSEQFKPVKIGEISADGKFTPVSGGELDTLRLEVREAWRRIVADEQRPEDFECVQAELLRQMREIADLREAIVGLLAMREDIEAELAALKARIADAPVAECLESIPFLRSSRVPRRLLGQRIALVKVEE